MKVYVIGFTCGGLAFVLAGYQMGLFRSGASLEIDSAIPVAEKKETPRAKFPEDLAPAAAARPIPQAAALDAGSDIHRLVFLRSTGAPHAWQECVPEEWIAERVEKTELVVVLGPQRKTFLSIHHYPNGAPPISRYQFETEASVVEAKTGKVLANRQFINVPRQIKEVESWELTALGQAVSFNTVFHWVVSVSRAHFPPEMNPAPPLTSIVR